MNLIILSVNSEPKIQIFQLCRRLISEREREKTLTRKFATFSFSV